MEPLDTADAVSAKIREIYGDVDFAAAAGVVHVTAVWAEPEGRHITLKINDDTPRSPHDLFVLNLARARAQAIVATGKMLRDEPDLSFDLQGVAAPGLAHWRREVMGLEKPPRLVILTSGRGLDPNHPALRGETPATIVTNRVGEAILTATPGAADLDVHVHEPTNIRTVVEWLRDRHSAKTVSIEAGPSTSVLLYDEPVVTSEVMLSVFGAEAIPDTVRGGPFVPRQRLERWFRPTGEPHPIDEPSGPWQFERLVRRTTSRSS